MFEDFDRRSIRISAIEGITGLKGISHAFENQINETEVELILSFLERKYRFSEEDGYDIRNFLLNVVGFSENSLKFINANYYEFFEGLTTKEACFIVLTKLLDVSNDIPTEYGFPSDFNYTPSKANTVQRTENGPNSDTFSNEENVSQLFSEQKHKNGWKWYPFVNQNSRRLQYEQILKRVMRTIQTDNNRLYFHGCSWESAIYINDAIQIIQRENATDFGMRNFYLTDTFSTAYVWAKRNTQSAIVIFAIPDSLIENEENKQDLSMRGLEDLEEWKNFVFKIRNKPKVGANLRERRLEYTNLLNNADSKNLILGPIFANPDVKAIKGVRYVKYGDVVPFQYSFKDLLAPQLNNYIAITLFIQDTN